MNKLGLAAVSEDRRYIAGAAPHNAPHLFRAVVTQPARYVRAAGVAAQEHIAAAKAAVHRAHANGQEAFARAALY